MLDPTASEANARDSIKKYFVDALEPQNIHVYFDKDLTSFVMNEENYEKCVLVSFDRLLRDTVGEHFIEIHICTQEDPEGWELTRISDSVFQLLIDSDMTDTVRRIPLYDTTDSANWVEIGKLLVSDIHERKQLTALNRTKYKTILVELRWPMRV